MRAFWINFYFWHTFTKHILILEMVKLNNGASKLVRQFSIVTYPSSCVRMAVRRLASCCQPVRVDLALVGVSRRVLDRHTIGLFDSSGQGAKRIEVRSAHYVASKTDVVCAPLRQ